MIAKLEDVKHGNVLWYATIYTIQGFKKAHIERYEIVGEVYQTDGGSIFCNCYKDYSNHVTEFSLKDANIIPNNYNEHRVFTTEGEAYSYVGSIFAGGGTAQLNSLRKENASLRRVLGTILDSTSPMVKINAISEARGLLAK